MMFVHQRFRKTECSMHYRGKQLFLRCQIFILLHFVYKHAFIGLNDFIYIKYTQSMDLFSFNYYILIALA